MLKAAAKRLFKLKRKKRSGTITFTGDYVDWAAARKDSSGYDTGVILEKTRTALQKVKNGEAVFERDSVLFDKPQYPFPVMAGLFRAALLESGRLGVVDFGGSLGSSYFQFRPLLGMLHQLEWLVVEQPAHVACGREYFETAELRFFESMPDCLARHKPNVLLLSGVLQYLPEPYSLLRELLAHGIRHVIIDRTPFLAANRDRLTVQTVPATIYPATYPAWFFDETKFLATLTGAGYSVVTDFAGADTVAPEDEPACFKGFILQKEGSK